MIKIIYFMNLCLMFYDLIPFAGLTKKSLCTFVKPLESFVVKNYVIEPQRFAKYTQRITKKKLIKFLLFGRPRRLPYGQAGGLM